MNALRWEQTKDIFQAALELPPPERERFLKESCQGDAALYDEIKDLLESFENAGSFMDAAAIGEVAAEIAGEKEDIPSGKQLGRCQIIKKIGAGGMGEVYLAKDNELERFVALKVLSAEFSKDEDRIRRFIREAKAASALNHPNIITIYEIGQFENLRFIATEYIGGDTLRTWQKREHLTLQEILDVCLQVASALNAAHIAGIAHRDIKPENIMVRDDGFVKVLDFGLAKPAENATQLFDAKAAEKSQLETTPGMVMGTIAYMSPEQARGKSTDARTDIWSLGVVLYELLTGVQPFTGDTKSDTIASVIKSDFALLGANTPPELSRIVEKTLRKNADERYKTVKDLIDDLKNYSASSPSRSKSNAKRR